MPTQLHQTFDLPFSSERAVSLMTDPEFLAELMVASGSLRPVITVTHDASSTTVSIQREFEGQWPSMVAPLIGETLSVSEERTWHAASPTGEISGTLDMYVKGQPVSMHGAIRVSPTQTGCTARIAGEIHAKVPFIGGMVEKLVLEQISAGIEIEAELLANA